MNDPSLRHRLNVALASGHLPQLRYQRHGRYAVREGVILSAYDVPSPIFQTAAVLESGTAPERVLEQAREFFGAERGWSVLVEADAGHPMEAWLRAGGWRVIAETLAMLLAPIPQPPAPPAELEIRRVVDEPGLKDHLGPLDEAAPVKEAPAPTSSPHSDDDADLVPANVDELLIPSLAVALDPDVALFTGYADGRRVGTAALYRTDSVAEIGGVAVSPHYRRRGFGTALTWAVIAEGVARGCDVAALHATAMGEPVYRAMGFRTFARHRRYIAPI